MTSRDPRERLLVGFRVLTLLALVTMLIEPVLISSQRETVRSHLALILDDSDSMKFSDPYTDESRAVESRRACKFHPRMGDHRFRFCGRRRD